VAGDYIFVLSTGNVLMGIDRADGRIKWVQQLPQYEDEKHKEDPILWRGPVLAGGKLWLAGTQGKLLSVDPQSGAVAWTLDIPEDVAVAPVVANGVMYLVTKDATLYSFK
jgi:outer membrane protein assembly factor BamB